MEQEPESPDAAAPAPEEVKSSRAFKLGCLGTVAVVVVIGLAWGGAFSGGSTWTDRTPEQLRGDAQVAAEHRFDGYTARPGYVGLVGSSPFVCVDLLSPSAFEDDPMVVVVFQEGEAASVGELQAGPCRPWREGLPDGVPVGQSHG